MLVASLAASAQVEKLIEVMEKGDPMLETVDTRLLVSERVYISDEGRGYKVSLYSAGGVFKRDPVKVGFYDNDGNLLMMVDTWHVKLNDDLQMLSLVENGFSKDSIPGCERVEKPTPRYIVPRKFIYDYVTKGEGYVRFVATTYGGYVYDVSAAYKKE